MNICDFHWTFLSIIFKIYLWFMCDFHMTIFFLKHISITYLDFWGNFEIKLWLKLTKSCLKWEKDRYSETYLDLTTLSHNFWNGVQKNHLQILGGQSVRTRSELGHQTHHTESKGEVGRAEGGIDRYLLQSNSDDCLDKRFVPADEEDERAARGALVR